MYSYLVRPLYPTDFLQRHGVGVEAHLGRYDKLETWPQYVPFVGGIHLPYSQLNIAALDDATRTQAIEAVKAAIQKATFYPVERLVMHLTAIEIMDDQIVGGYDRMIDGLRDLAAYAAACRRILCLENTCNVWNPTQRRWGVSSAEWRRVWRDVDRANVKRTLDTSHAATAVMDLETPEKRVEAIWDFLVESDAIERVHWSDSILGPGQIKKDRHLVPGQGDLPLAFHRAIAGVSAVKLLEQTSPAEVIAKGLSFVQSL
jgi:sugar phosphate isomerase/epimerase